MNCAGYGLGSNGSKTRASTQAATSNILQSIAPFGPFVIPQFLYGVPHQLRAAAITSRRWARSIPAETGLTTGMGRKGAGDFIYVPNVAGGMYGNPKKCCRLAKNAQPVVVRVLLHP